MCEMKREESATGRELRSAIEQELETEARAAGRAADADGSSLFTEGGTGSLIFTEAAAGSLMFSDATASQEILRA